MADPGTKEQPTPADVRRAAMDLLARREYGRSELAGRLAAKALPETLVEPVLDALAAEGLQSDARYAESFVGARANRGQGPVRIRLELERRGVAGELVDAALAEAGDWDALAAAARVRKFGAKPPADFREKARQARFLQYRGFTAEQVRAALEGAPDED